ASFRWTVSDGSLSSANTGTLTLNVTPVNDAPTAGIIANQTLTEGNRFSLVLANGTFNDVDTGDILTLSATLADGSSLPSWLTFDPVTGSFSGTPGATDTGTLSIRVSATDRAGAQASSSFTLQIAAINSNQSPIVSGTLTDQTAPQDGRFNYTIPTNVFVDPDSGDSLSLSAAQANGSPLPSWLSFDPATQTFSGVPDTSAIGVVTIRVTATDSNQATVSATFSLSVTRAQQNLGDPEFLINDGRTSAPTTTTLRIDTAPGVPVTLGSLLAPTGAGAQNAAFLAVTTTTTSSLFQATRNSTGEKPFTGTQLSGIFSRAASEGGTTRFESALGSFPSFNQGGANGGSSSLAGLFSGISLPSLNTMEVFSGGSWRSINTSNDSTAITTASTAGFTGLRGQLQQSGDEELQRLAALEQALSEMDQRQG
ncbi:putative Ig domain-containing protein, partial [Pantoea allii]|uniref:putative Ig domain-containing protein n=1 Tax=Pantoea allii TaxID=574096 RepID=UPI0024B82A80